MVNALYDFYSVVLMYRKTHSHDDYTGFMSFDPDNTKYYIDFLLFKNVPDFKLL